MSATEPAAAATEIGEDRLAVLDTRPSAGEPRPYHFPSFTRSRLDHGLELVLAHVPGRPLLRRHRHER